MAGRTPIGDEAEQLANYLGREPTTAELNSFLNRPKDAPPLPAVNPRRQMVSVTGYFKGEDLSGNPGLAENIVVDAQGNHTYQQSRISSRLTGGTAAIGDKNFTSATAPIDTVLFTPIVKGEVAEEGTSNEGRTVPKRIIRREKELTSAIEENILDAYDSPSYHFRLFMMPEDANRAGATLGYDKIEQIVIAETASSSIGIDEVSIETVGSITKEAGTGTATKISFVLKQPFGVSVLDYIESSARRLGIRNWMKAPFYLELSFRARDPNSLEPILDGPLSQQLWVWPIMFTKTSIAVNTGGSVYNIEAVHTGDQAYTNEIADLDQVEAIPVKTVGQFFAELEKRLNKRKNDLAEDESSSNFSEHMDEYQFYVFDEIAKESIILDGQDSAPGRSGPFDVNDDLKTITFHLNTSIDRIVDSIMSMTNYFQVAATGEKTPDSSPEPNDDKEAVQFTKLWRVIADSRIKGYDATRNDYSHVYRYLIIPTDVPTTRNPAKEKTESEPKTIISVLRRGGVLKKAYNYLFTGLNDQVLDFDINFNFNWYAALPLNEGLHGSGDSVGLPQSSAVTNPSDDPEEVKKQFIDLSNVTWTSVSPVAQDTARNQTNAGVRVPTANNRRRGNVGGGPTSRPAPTVPSAPTNLGYIRNDAPSIFTGRPEGEVSSLTAATEAAKEKTKQPFQRPSSGLVPGFPRLAEDLFEAEEAGIIPKIPVSYRRETHGKENAINAVGEQTRGKVLLSALFEQARSPAAADLLSIELKVKGDPYWLEPAPVGKRKRPTSLLEQELRRRGLALNEKDGTVIESDEGSPESSEDNAVISSASTTTDQTFFAFRMFTPQTFDEPTGITRVPTTNNILNGLYAVAHTRHEFTGGMFTQTLKSIRLLDLDMTAELIEDLYKGGSIRDVEETVTEQAAAAVVQPRQEENNKENTDQGVTVSATSQPPKSEESGTSIFQSGRTGVGRMGRRGR
jgi:hypothetical protein